MIYEIKNDNLLLCDEDCSVEKDNILILTDSESFSRMENKYVELKTDVKIKGYHCTNMEVHDNYIYFTFVIPTKIGAGKVHFDYILYKNKAVIVDDEGVAKKVIDTLFDNGKRKNFNMAILLYEILSSLISKDLIFLEGIEEKLSSMEDKIISQSFEKFNKKLSEIKGCLRAYYRHYSQLLMVCDGIFEREFFHGEAVKLFSLFSSRLERLKAETELLREYSLQIQDMYHAEIEVRQNDIMKVLTIVATVVLPLSLITGWYGMNFNMPELGLKYGYTAIIILSAAVVVISLIVCKKKKYF